MSIVEKIKSFWLGSDETYDEGFDDLFRIESGLGNSNNNGNNKASLTTPSSLETSNLTTTTSLVAE